jgi:hypothetical protein
MNVRLAGVTAVVAVMVCALDAYPCKTARSVSNIDMVREADAIVRVSAENYTVAPKAPISSTGFDVESDSRIRFKVFEVVRGKIPDDHLVLPGILVDTDDFNDHASPYNFVRPEGRRGSCFVLVQPEMERWRFPLASIPPFGRGFSRHRYDHQAIPQHGCVPAEPASVSPGKIIVAPPRPSVSTSG